MVKFYGLDLIQTIFRNDIKSIVPMKYLSWVVSLKHSS